MPVAVEIRPDKTCTIREFTDLADYQRAVGGSIEGVPLDQGVMLFVNEEYLYQFGPEDVNWTASDVAGTMGRPEFCIRPILGPAVLVGPADHQGETLDVPEWAMRRFRRVCKEAGASITDLVVT